MADEQWKQLIANPHLLYLVDYGEVLSSYIGDKNPDKQDIVSYSNVKSAQMSPDAIQLPAFLDLFPPNADAPRPEIMLFPSATFLSDHYKCCARDWQQKLQEQLEAVCTKQPQYSAPIRGQCSYIETNCN